MKFLVLLLCLLITHFLLKDASRFDDGRLLRYYARFRAWLDRLLGGASPAQSTTADMAAADSTHSTHSTIDTIDDPALPPQPTSVRLVRYLLPLLLVYAVPLCLLGLLLLLLGDLAFSVPAMLTHIAVVLLAFDRSHPGRLTEGFLQAWRAQDDASCLSFLERERVSAAAGDSPERLAGLFGRQFIYRCFETLFTVFFWYVLLEPVAVLFCIITYKLHDYHGRRQAVPEQPTLQRLSRLIWLLEWLPLRLLALTFSLAGNFVRSFDSLRDSFWSFAWDQPNDELLYTYARSALLEEPGDGDLRQQKAGEIRALRSLLERSLFIWLAGVAAVTLLGLSA